MLDAVNELSDTLGSMCTQAAYTKVPAEKRTARATNIGDLRDSSCARPEYVKRATTGDELANRSMSCNEFTEIKCAQHLCHHVLANSAPGHPETDAKERNRLCPRERREIVSVNGARSVTWITTAVEHFCETR
jgi:hypothetical protein